jgi:protein-S-isoprenylcysteine O-methyltransferase Ste14
MGLVHVLYAALSYAVFLATFVYAIGFVGDLAVPKTIDTPAGPGGWAALVVDLAVLALFAVQHSVMARPAFKRWWTRFVPSAAERSTYVLLSSLLLILMFAAWRPLGATVWDLRGTGAGTLLLATYGLGWLIVLASTFMISHFELFGLTQAWRRLRERPEPPATFVERFLYRFVRHPIMLGFLVAFWSAPAMSVGHLLFSIMTTGYILVGVQLEEHDLRRALGAAYDRYCVRVPMLLPFTKRPASTGSGTQSNHGRASSG